MDDRRGILQRIREALGAGERPAEPRRLEICERCGADAVVPVRWHDLDDCWRMTLRCGGCEARRTLIVTDEEADRYGRRLDAAAADIAAAAAQLDLERMDVQAEAFSAALERDLIDPTDFRH